MRAAFATRGPLGRCNLHMPDMCLSAAYLLLHTLVHACIPACPASTQRCIRIPRPAVWRARRFRTLNGLDDRQLLGVKDMHGHPLVPPVIVQQRTMPARQRSAADLLAGMAKERGRIGSVTAPAEISWRPPPIRPASAASSRSQPSQPASRPASRPASAASSREGRMDGLIS